MAGFRYSVITVAKFFGVFVSVSEVRYVCGWIEIWLAVRFPVTSGWILKRSGSD